MQLRTAIALSAFAALTAGTANADLIITGVIDGDQTGGNPKAIVVTATAAIADLSIYGVGSANNGGGSDGEEFTFAAGPAAMGDVFVIAANTASNDFFNNNYVGLNVIQNGAANINGDDAVELFMSGGVIDIYGDINVEGDPPVSWNYADGYAVRTGGSAGAFVQANYDSLGQALDGLDEATTVSTLANAYGFTVVPEPGSLALLGLGGLLIARRRRS